jgi:hypothetical protein
MVDEVSDRLAGRGYRSASLHGDMAQAERERVLRRFREGQTEVLVATDVAARGLDIEGVTHVVNFDVPWDPEQYVHRIGRTGRAGREGDAITLVTPRDYRLLRTIERMLGSRITRKRLPSMADLAARRREATKGAVVAAVAAGDLDPYLILAGELSDELDPVEVAAATLRLWDEARTGTGEGTTLAGVIRAAAAEEQAAKAHQAAAAAAADRQPAGDGMRRLFVTAGAADGLRPQDLVGAIANEAGIPGRAIGSIDIYDRFSFVEVPAGNAQRVVEVLSQTTLRGRRVGVRLADEGDERAEIGERPARSERGRPFRPGPRGAPGRPARPMRPAPSARPPRPGGRPGARWGDGPDGQGGTGGQSGPWGAERPFQPYRSDRPGAPDRPRWAGNGPPSAPADRGERWEPRDDRGAREDRGPRDERPPYPRPAPPPADSRPRRSAPSAPGTTRLRRRPRPTGNDGDPGS